jgi:hypothetical protein
MAAMSALLNNSKVEVLCSEKVLSLELFAHRYHKKLVANGKFTKIQFIEDLQR